MLIPTRLRQLHWRRQEIEIIAREQEVLAEASSSILAIKVCSSIDTRRDGQIDTTFAYFDVPIPRARVQG